MLSPNLVILYVNNPPASSEFYKALLRREPVEASPTFVLFALEAGLMLGLWSRHTVEPSAAAAGGGAELAFRVNSDLIVDQVHANWRAQGLAILQSPTVMDFGRTFVGHDPDGHRLRVYCPAEVSSHG
jgi:catechol 2,3-dioxygenase-like lactoylglutathione lyase family enzyme